MMLYPIAPDGVFWTVQGEGALLGVPMHFVRLAGCATNCPQCDTDYREAGRLSATEIVERLQRLPHAEWAWLTGGEPTDHDLGPLLSALRGEGYRVAVATSGVREFDPDRVSFLSVSPHSWAGWAQRRGEQVNVVPGLNGLRLADMPPGAGVGFAHRYVTPLGGARGPGLAACLEFLRAHPDWRLGCQCHRAWGLS
jgi:7-carboxy-7-deazaguanine synthase